ncbi:MAG: cytochrome c biogenesis protein CcdA [Anaerolineae bacterium]
MRKGWSVVAFLSLVLGLILLAPLSGAAAGPEPAPLPQATDPATGQPVVRFYLFYSDTCPHCHDVMENYLPTVYEKYGDQVEYQYFNINGNTDDYLLMLGLAAKLGVPEDERGYVPTLVIGDHVLVGSGDEGIPGQLEGYIDDYLAQGGVDWPATDDLPEVTAPTPEPTVQALVFLDPKGPSFEDLNTFLTSLSQSYAGQLQLMAVDLSNEQNVATVNQLYQAWDIEPPDPGTPQVLIDHRLLVGLDEIKADLPRLVDEYLAQGGIQVPSWEELVSGTPVTETEPTGTARPIEATPTAGSPAEQPAIYIAYFEKAGCQECARTGYDLQVVREQYPQIVVDSFSIEEAENKALNEWLCEKYGVPEDQRLSTPMLFVGDTVLIGEDARLENLLPAVAQYAETGAERTWSDFDPQAGEQGILARFRSFGLLTVLGAGLIDGLNPCAFATLVFFISYLAFTGRRGREILLVGLAFAVGVFVTYLLVGLGLLKVVQSLGFFTTLGRWVYLATALLCVALAALTFRDYFKARQGKASEMTLKLPLRLRRRINQVIREGAQMRAFVGVAFFTGFVVSLIELACTGQVYLPTIVYVLSQPDMAARAFLYLVLYCVMFIVPLIVVFVLSYFGTTSEQLGQFVNRHTAGIKLATGLVFVGLALWMAWALAPLFGLVSPWNWILLAGVVVVIAAAAVVLLYNDRRHPESQPRRRRSRA